MICRFVTFSASLLALAVVAFAQAPRPNFVFIIGDDISAEDLGCYGNRGIRTPNLDRLAAESMRFTNGYLRNAWPDLPLTGTREDPNSAALQAARLAGRLTPLQENIFIAPRPTEEFYDLSTDPIQAKNLVGTVDASRLNRMRTLLDRWTKETGDSVPSLAERTPADVDYVTGKKKTEFWRGQPPGASARALQINHPGPVREGNPRAQSEDPR